jgi:hypothetical protein
MYWIPIFLDIIKQDFQIPLPPQKDVEHLLEDVEWIKKNALKDDPFDTLKLKKEMVTAVEQKKAFLQKRVCELGSIFVLSYEKIPESTWTFWWHCVRLLCPSKKVRVVFYMHPKKRDTPFKGTNIDSQHINGGVTFPCDEKTVIIYRKEEATRVLIHELFHASCSDPYQLPVPFVEADTESWAEIFLCAALAKGNEKKFHELLNKQFIYAIQQTEYLTKNHTVLTPEDYAWRYTIGRLEVWKRLGFKMPLSSLPSLSLKIPETLRLTNETLEP